MLCVSVFFIPYFYVLPISMITKKKKRSWEPSRFDLRLGVWRVAYFAASVD